jgi:ABC-type transporter Mla MlaB component
LDRHNIAGALDWNEEVVMSGHDRNTWGRSFPARTAAVEAVPDIAVHVPEDTKSDVLIDFTDSHSVDFEGLTLLLTAQRLAHSEDRQVWLMGLPESAWSVLEAMGLDDLFVRVSSPGELSN